MQGQEVKNHISSLQGDYLERYPFSNLSVALSFLDHANGFNRSDHSEEIVAAWEPNSVKIIEEYGGTNCIGATMYLLEKIKKDIPESLSDLIVTPSERLPHGITRQDVPYQHAALKIAHPNMPKPLLIDPGLSIPEPIPLNVGSRVKVDGTTYAIEDGEGIERLLVTKSDGRQRKYELLIAKSDIDLERDVQKPLFTITDEFKIEKYRRDGTLDSYVKINLQKQNMVIFVKGAKYTLPISETSFTGRHVSELQQALDDSKLLDKLRALSEPSNQKKLRDSWHQVLLGKYFEDKPHLLSPYQSSWEELGQKGYIGGGVAMVITNELGQVLMYQIPTHKAKPKIGRVAGMYNIFTETAEHIGEVKQVTTLEPFDRNLKRGLFEELGLAYIPGELKYFETDYPGTNSDRYRARIALISTTSDLLDHITPKRNEVGQPRWVDVKQLDHGQVDPNAWQILNKLTSEKQI